MARVHTLEEFRGLLQEAVNQLQAQIAEISALKSLRERMYRSGEYRPYQIHDQIQERLDEVEDIVDIIAADLAAIYWKNAREIRVGTPAGNTYCEITKNVAGSPHTLTFQWEDEDGNTTGVNLGPSGSGVLIDPASHTFLVLNAEDSVNDGQHAADTGAATTANKVVVENTSYSARASNTRDTSVVLRLYDDGT